MTKETLINKIDELREAWGGQRMVNCAEALLDDLLSWIGQQQTEKPAAGIWQPWESAPKDGSMILARWGKTKDFMVVVYADDEWLFYGYMEPFNPSPSHWAPIYPPEEQ